MNVVRVIFDGYFNAVADQDSLREIPWDFTFDDFSPNIEFLENALITFKCTGDSGDPINFIDNWMSSNPGENIPASLRNIGINKDISGVMDLYSSDARYDRKFGIYTIPFVTNVETLKQSIEGFNLRALNNGTVTGQNAVSESMYEVVRYVLASVPDFIEAILVGYGGYIAAQALAEAIRLFAETLKEAINSGIDSVSAALKVVAMTALSIIYLAAVVFAILALLKTFTDTIFQKPKAYYCLRVITILQKAFGHFGFSFETDIITGKYEQMCVLPFTTETGRLLKKPVNDPMPNLNLLTFMEGIGDFFNGRWKIFNEDKRVLFTTREKLLESPASYFLEGLKNEGESYYNQEDLVKTISIDFIKDPVDKHALIQLTDQVKIGERPVETGGNSFVANFEITGNDANAIALKGEKKVTIPFSRAVRKNITKGYERVFNSIFDTLLRIASVFPGVDKPSTNDKLGDRTGYMLLENEFISSNKLFIIADNDKIDSENFELIHAETSYENYYSDESPVVNQWTTTVGRDREPLCSVTELDEIIDNNVIRDSNGDVIILTKNVRSEDLHEYEYRRRLSVGDLGHIPESKFIVNKTGD